MTAHSGGTCPADLAVGLATTTLGQWRWLLGTGGAGVQARIIIISYYFQDITQSAH